MLPNLVCAALGKPATASRMGWCWRGRMETLSPGLRGTRAESQTVSQASPGDGSEHTGRPDASAALRKAGRGSGSEATPTCPLPGERPSFSRVPAPAEGRCPPREGSEAVRWVWRVCLCPPPADRAWSSPPPPSSSPPGRTGFPIRSWFLHVREEHAAEGGAASSTCRLLLCHSGGRRHLHTSCLAPAPHASAAGSARWASASCAAGAGPSRWCWHGPGWWPQRLRR